MANRGETNRRNNCMNEAPAQGAAMPDGGARSATLERTSAVSLTDVLRGQVSCADHSGFRPVVDPYGLAV
jgi:hypothetical protein